MPAPTLFANQAQTRALFGAVPFGCPNGASPAPLRQSVPLIHPIVFPPRGSSSRARSRENELCELTREIKEIAAVTPDRAFYSFSLSLRPRHDAESGSKNVKHTFEIWCCQRQEFKGSFRSNCSVSPYDKVDDKWRKGCYYEVNECECVGSCHDAALLRSSVPNISC